MLGKKLNVEEKLWKQLGWQFGKQLGDQLWKQLGYQLWERLGEQILRQFIGEQILRQLRKQLWGLENAG